MLSLSLAYSLWGRAHPHLFPTKKSMLTHPFIAKARAWVTKHGRKRTSEIFGKLLFCYWITSCFSVKGYRALWMDLRDIKWNKRPQNNIWKVCQSDDSQVISTDHFLLFHCQLATRTSSVADHFSSWNADTVLSFFFLEGHQWLSLKLRTRTHYYKPDTSESVAEFESPINTRIVMPQSAYLIINMEKYTPNYKLADCSPKYHKNAVSLEKNILLYWI